MATSLITGCSSGLGRALAESHFFGAVAMIKAVLPGMRARRSGAIVNISSIGAQLTPVGSGYYSAVKSALEGLSGSLRLPARRQGALRRGRADGKHRAPERITPSESGRRLRPLNWYRNFDRNWELLARFEDTTIDCPAMYVAGQNDPVVQFMPPSLMDGHVTDLRTCTVLPTTGHWVQEQAPDHVNRLLVEFLAGVADPAW